MLQHSNDPIKKSPQPNPAKKIAKEDPRQKEPVKK